MLHHFPVEICHNIIDNSGDNNDLVNLTTLVSKTWFALTAAKRWRHLMSDGFPESGDYEHTVRKLQAHPDRCERVKHWVISGSNRGGTALCSVDHGMLLGVMHLLPECTELTIQRCVWAETHPAVPHPYQPKRWSRVTLCDLVCMNTSPILDVPLFASSVDDLVCARLDILKEDAFTGRGKDRSPDEVITHVTLPANIFETDMAMDLWDTHGLPCALPVMTPSRVTSLYLNALTPEATVLASHHINSWRRHLQEIRVFSIAGVTATDLTNSFLDFPLRSCSKLRILEIGLPDEPLTCIAQRLTKFWANLPRPVQQVVFVIPPLIVCTLAGGHGMVQLDCAHLPNLACVNLVVYKRAHAHALRRKISFENVVNIQLVVQMSTLPDSYHETVAFRGHAWAADNYIVL